MGSTSSSRAKTREILNSLTERGTLITLIHSLTRELERVEEDNCQLRAAVGMYREVMRRRGVCPGQELSASSAPRLANM